MAGPGEQVSRPKDIGADYGRAGYAGQNIADAARNAAGDAMQAVREQGGDLFEQARDMAAGARDKLMDQAQEQMQSQKQAGADYLDGLAGTLDRMAGELGGAVPFAGPWMREAGRQVEAVADAVREGDLSDLARQAQDFARRQPTVAFGIAMVAGFGLVRLLKTSATASSSASAGGASGMRRDSSSGASQGSSSGMAGGSTGTSGVGATDAQRTLRGAAGMNNP